MTADQATLVARIWAYTAQAADAIETTNLHRTDPTQTEHTAFLRPCVHSPVTMMACFALEDRLAEIVLHRASDGARIALNLQLGYASYWGLRVSVKSARR